jgi:hypothetical protein
LPWYNKRFAQNLESSYLPLPKDKDLDTIFSKKYERIVKADNTIEVMGEIIQIPPNDTRFSYRKAKVDACILEDDRILVVYKGSVIAESKLSKNNRADLCHSLQAPVNEILTTPELPKDIRMSVPCSDAVPMSRRKYAAETGLAKPLL